MKREELIDVRDATKFTLGLLGTIALAVAAVPRAEASPFGPAAGSGEINGTPTVITSGTTSIAVNDAPIFWSAASGSLLDVNGRTSGESTGTIDFSSTVGKTINETISGFLFNVGSEGFSFDVSSVFTTSFSYNSKSGSLSLYILGSMGNGTLASSPTSLTLTANDTSGGPWSSSFTLANPPDPPTGVPEPASLALVGTALAGLGAMRRRKAQG